ncbi:MAG: TolC family protein [Sulfurimicrobium sp.]|nr:TolC family protein [Sulfurimicrobium sp.]
MRSINHHRCLRPARAWLLTLAMLAVPASHAAPLTLDEALRLSAAHSPALAAAKAREQGAQAALETALAYPNPELELASGVSRPRLVGGTSGRNEMLGLSQQLELPSLRAARREGAEAGIVSGTAAFGDAQLNQRTLVKLAFFDVLRRQEEAALAAENHALLLLIRNRVKIKVEVGESPRYELVKSEAEAMAAGSAARSAEFRVTQARDRLRALIGASLAEDFEVAVDPPFAAELPALDELRQDLLARQPLLKVAEAEKRRAQARVEQERAARLPQPTLRLSSERDPDMNQWRAGVALPLPLWNRRAGPIGEAVAGMHRAEAEAQQIHLGLLAELDQAYSRFQIAKRQVKTFESGLMQEAENAMKVAEAAYRFGERGILDYLDAQRVLRNTRVDYLNARYELQAALIEIERLRATPVTGEKS